MPLLNTSMVVAIQTLTSILSTDILNIYKLTRLMSAGRKVHPQCTAAVQPFCVDDVHRHHTTRQISVYRIRR